MACLKLVFEHGGRGLCQRDFVLGGFFRGVLVRNRIIYKLSTPSKKVQADRSTVAVATIIMEDILNFEFQASNQLSTTLWFRKLHAFLTKLL